MRPSSPSTDSVAPSRHPQPSPGDRWRRRSGAVTPLTESERRELEKLLESETSYMDDPSFHEADAERRLFECGPEVPEPDQSWYMALANGESRRASRAPRAELVLTDEQERALFLRYNYARCRMAELQEEVRDEGMRPCSARQLLDWAGRAAGLREKIAGFNLALVLAMARRFKGGMLDTPELISEGNMALLRAIDKFRVDRGFKFSTYACRAIIKALGRAGKKQARHRELFPTEGEGARERTDYSQRRADEFERRCVEEASQIFRANRAGLSPVERRVLRCRFALDGEDGGEGCGKPMTLEQVGRLIGVSKERVRQIQIHALARLRRTLEESFIDGSRPAVASGHGG